MIDYAKIKFLGLLHWSERWTQTDMVYLAKGGFWLTFNKIIGTITSLALAMAYARLLPQETYGLYKYILSIMGIISIIALPGVNSAIQRSVALGLEGSAKEGLKTKIRWGSLAAFVGILTALYYYSQGNRTLAFGVIIASIAVPFIESLSVAYPIMQGRMKFKELSILSSLRQIVIPFSLIITLFFTKNLLIFLGIYYAVTILSDAFIFIFSFRKLNSERDPESHSLSLHLSVMNIIGLASGYLDKILTWHFLGAGALAVYSFAIIPIDQAEAYLKSSYTLAFPKIAAQETKVLKKTLIPKIIKFSIILIIPVVLYILIAPFLYKVFFPQYIESIKYSQVFALTLLFFPQRMISQLLLAQARKKDLYIQNTAMPAIKIILMVLLIPLFGIWGMIWANFVYLTLAGALLYYLFKNLKDDPIQ